ncbi:threonylcarbamoyladenosine tRNA methylthiotransferase-like isoform X2 [Dendronephthya gigantea]|nr:threonylcarbamoyladenosine tRNA methylthiotransferase-like isoform X2 [Dendronephthya gigantea]
MKDFKDEKPSSDSIIPGTQNIYIKTWGCSHNNSDSEYMAGQLAAYGYKIIDNPENADLWLLNSCTVKNPSEDNFRNSIKKAKESGKHLILAGCVGQGQPGHETLRGLSIIGVQQIDRIVEAVEETLKGHTVRILGQKKENGKKIGGAKLDLPKIRKNPLIEIIAISTGCLNQCTYCKTKHARGELGSYSPEEIVARAKQAFQEGVVEIWLTSEDTGAYGRDIGSSLPELLWQLIEVIPEGAMLRLGMTNPPYILEHLEEIAKIMNSPRMYSFLHCPVQSGSDSVLADMKREYCIDDFKHVVQYLQERVPHITVATDVICGFPTETEQDFEETVKIVELFKFPSLFINQFYPRPGTPAARMKRIDTAIVKGRTRRITKLFNTYQPYDHKLGEKQKVLITEESHDGIHYVSHNKSYDQVLVRKDEGDLMGKMVEVVITETGKHFLKGKVLKNNPVHTPSIAPPFAKGVVSGVKQIPKPFSTTSLKSNVEFWIKSALLVLLMAVIFDLIRVGRHWLRT